MTRAEGDLAQTIEVVAKLKRRTVLEIVEDQN
jgi:hypothetical protein